MGVIDDTVADADDGADDGAEAEVEAAHEPRPSRHGVPDPFLDGYATSRYGEGQLDEVDPVGIAMVVSSLL